MPVRPNYPIGDPFAESPSSVASANSFDGARADSEEQSETLKLNDRSAPVWEFPVSKLPDASDGLGQWRRLPLADSDRYDYLALLGTGGMGRVFKVRDRRLDRIVALKALQYQDRETVGRFLREAKAMAQVRHPNICTLFEAGEIEGQPFLVMEFIDGKTLDKFDRELSVERKALLALGIAEALQAIHRLGLVHRDIKPGNILVKVQDSGEIKPFLTDFGLVRIEGQSDLLTSDGTILGTPQFMSPEQATGGVLDRRTDVYSFGATLYAYFAGRPPFSGKTPAEVIRKVIDEDPPPLRKIVPSIPEDLETIVMTCLEKEPERRYQSARAVADDLKRFLDGEPLTARKMGLTYRLRRTVRRHRTLTGVSAVSLLTISFLLGLWIHEAGVAARETKTAQQLESEISQLEGGVRDVNLLPPREGGEMRRRIRNWMQSRKAEVGVNGHPGSSEYVLGRGHLALGEYQEARAALESAWNQGYRKPEVAYALGQVFDALADWQADLEENAAPSAGNGPETAAFLRGEAVRWLGLARNAPVSSPEYRDALIAYNEERFVDAKRLAERAFENAPWLYEAKELSGKSDVALGRAKLREGNPAAALELFEKAAPTFRVALNAGEGDAGVYENDAVRWIEIARAQRKLNLDFHQAIELARSDVRQAATINPESPRISRLETWLQELSENRPG
jgi:serine/threonine-protein kinase